MINSIKEVRLESKDKPTQKLIEQIEKIVLLQLWCNKSKAFLERYLLTLGELDATTCKDETGILIERNEALLQAAVTIFLRCFHDQPSFHLKISDVSKDSRLVSMFKTLKKLRDDEFVHWKGLRSSVKASFLIEIKGASEIAIQNNLNIAFHDKMGSDDTDQFKELINQTSAILEARRQKCFDKLMERLKDEKAFIKTKFLCTKTNQPIFPKKT